MELLIQAAVALEDILVHQQPLAHKLTQLLLALVHHQMQMDQILRRLVKRQSEAEEEALTQVQEQVHQAGLAVEPDLLVEHFQADPQLQVKEMQEAQKDWMHEVRKEHEKIDGRVKDLENWKLVFTTKLTIYSSIAIVAGTAIGNLAVFAFKYAITN